MASDTEVYSPVCISDAVHPSDDRDDAASGRDSLPIDQEYAPLEEAAVASSAEAVDGASRASNDDGVASADDDGQREPPPRRPAEAAVDDSPAASSAPPPPTNSMTQNTEITTDSSDAATADQTAHFAPSAPSQQLPMNATGYPPAGLQYPPFFANPFMTPYLPQATMGTMGVVPQQPVDPAHQLMSAAPEQTFADPNYRMNPFTGGYYLAPSQYQEMMQHYLQSLLHAASYATDPSANAHSPAGDSARPTSDDVSNGLAEMKLAQGTRPLPAQLPPYVQQMMPQMTFNPLPFPASADEKRSGASSVEPGVSSSSSVASSLPAADDHRRPSVPKSDSSSTVNQGNDPTPSSGAPSQPLSVASPATTIASSAGDSALTSLNNSPAKTLHDKLPRIEDGLSSQSESEVEVKAATRPPDAENPTAVLIKKQMQEIEKEINRRVHNQNVKKHCDFQIDPHEIEQLLSEQRQCEEELMRFYQQRLAATSQPNANDKSALPWSGESSMSDAAGGPKQFRQAPDPRSMNEIASERVAGVGNGQPSLAQFSPQPHLPMVAPNLYQPHFPQAAMTTAAAMQQPSMLPMGAYPQQTMMTGQPPPGAHMGVFRPPPPSQSFVPQTAPMNYTGQLPPQYAAALLQQMQQETANRRPPAFVDPTASPLTAPVARMAQPPTAGVAQPPSDDPFRSEHGHGNGVWSPPAQERPHWTNGAAHDGKRSPFPLNNNSPTKEQLEAGNGDDPPVWVMRDSYLKRMKRDEERAQHMERRLQEETLRTADTKNADSDTDVETDKLLLNNQQRRSSLDDENGKQNGGKAKKKEVMVHEPAVLIEGVLFRARYLGSTQLVCEGRPSKTTRMMQAQEAVARIKAPDGEPQPSTDVDLFISTEKIMVLNTDLQDILMDHALRTISYIADIGDVVVLMARRMSQSASQEECQDDGIRKTPRVICHVFESDEASFIAQSIGQAFQVAYVEFLRANGIDDPGYLREIDYQEVLNSQELMGEELEMFARKETQKDVVVPKAKGEPLGIVVVESGWGSMLPTVVIANLAPGGPASRCNLLNIGDQIIAINGISLVGLQLATAQQNIKNSRSSTAVKLTVVHTPPVVEVRIKRPDTKYQLGFSVQNGVICSLLRGGIAERGGIRVGHRIIEINGQSVVAVAHEKIVNMLATAIGEIHMKTMPTSMFRLLTGQEVPNYI